MTKVISISPRIFTGSAVSIPFTVMFHGKSDKRRFLGSSVSFPFTSSCSQYRENLIKLGLAPISKTAKNYFLLFDTFTVVIMHPGDRPQSVYNMVLGSLGFLYSGLLSFWPSSPGGSTEVGSVVLVLSCSWGHSFTKCPFIAEKAFRSGGGASWLLACPACSLGCYRYNLSAIIVFVLMGIIVPLMLAPVLLPSSRGSPLTRLLPQFSYILPHLVEDSFDLGHLRSQFFHDFWLLFET